MEVVFDSVARDPKSGGHGSTRITRIGATGLRSLRIRAQIAIRMDVCAVARHKKAGARGPGHGEFGLA